MGDIPDTNTDYYEGGDSYEWPEIDNDCTYYWIEVDDSKVVPSEYPCPPGFVCGDVEATHSILVKDCGGITFHTERAGTANCPNEGGEVVVLNPNKPCPGDPVPYPRIASQDPDASGLFGGVFSDQYRTYDGVKKKIHAGTNIKTYQNQPIFSMFNGRVTWISDGLGDLGNYVQITTKLNGTECTILYGHLGTGGLPNLGDEVRAGDLIGYSDKNSENLAVAMEEGAEQHVHIEKWVGPYVWNKNYPHNLSLSRPNHVDPLDYFATEFDQNLNPINDCYVSTN